MKVFVTGASGFIGRAVVKELHSKGHSVLALARSDTTEQQLKDAKCEVLRGSLTDLDVLKSGAKKADAVIHLAFGHEFFFAKDIVKAYMESGANDRNAIAAIGDALVGSNKPFSIASGYGYDHDTVSSELSPPATEGFASLRQSSVDVLLTYKDKKVNVNVVRIPPVTHDVGDKGFANMLINSIKKLGFVPKFGDSNNHWMSVHRADLATLFVLAIEKGTPGATYHAHAEWVKVIDILTMISTKLKLPFEDKSPELAPQLFGMIGSLLLVDMRATNDITRKALGYNPTGIPLLEDMDKNYF